VIAAVVVLALLIAAVGLPALRSVAARTEPSALPPAPATAAALPVLQPTSIPMAVPTRSPLEPILLSLGHDSSYGAAAGEIQALWGSMALERTELRTHMDQVRRFDFPVILEMFHPTRRDTCYIALLRVSGDTAVLGYGVGVPITVSLTDVDRLWTRQAVFLWHDPEALTAVRADARAAAWALAELGRLGYTGQPQGLAATVAQFQQDTDLQPDGILGTRTIMAIYSRGERPRPRLTGGQS
jgi:hypothetical protein